MSVEITRLPNGINVVTHHMPHLETAALGIWVKAGALLFGPRPISTIARKRVSILPFGSEGLAFEGTR